MTVAGFDRLALLASVAALAALQLWLRPLPGASAGCW